MQVPDEFLSDLNGSHPVVDVEKEMSTLGDLSDAANNEVEVVSAANLRLARHLFATGMQVDPQHGPLYHAYGNMELVAVYLSVH